MNLKLMQISKLDLALLLQLIGLVLAVLADQYIQTKHRKLLLFIAALAFGLIVQNHVEYYLDKEKNDVLFRTIVSIIGYSIRPVLIVLLLETVNTEKNAPFSGALPDSILLYTCLHYFQMQYFPFLRIIASFVARLDTVAIFCVRFCSGR